MAKKWPSKEGDAISIRSDSLWGNSSRCPVQSSPGAFSSATGPLAPEGDTRRETNTRCVQEAPSILLIRTAPKKFETRSRNPLWTDPGGTDLAVKRPEMRRLLIGN